MATYKKKKTQRFTILHSNDMHGDFLANILMVV